jgi:DNA-directed RNA polymerase specialized sigma24 family protein
VRACSDETKRYRKSGENDPRFCLELFRRALSYVAAVPGKPRPADPEAQNQLVVIYTPFIEANINRQTMQLRDLDDLVQDIWTAFWRSAGNGELAFDHLGKALLYLQNVVRTLSIKHYRRLREARRTESLDASEDWDDSLAQADTALSELTKRRFAERCRELIPDPLEWRIYSMRYSLVLKPQAIAARLEADGVQLLGKPPTARKVSDLLDRLMKRLGADAEIQDLLGPE